MESTAVDTSFLTLVESRWTQLCRSSGSVRITTLPSRPSADQLVLDVSTSEARAQIKARDALRTLDIKVARFKDEKTLSEGLCAHDADVDRRLRSLLVDLTASPFA